MLGLALYVVAGFLILRGAQAVMILRGLLASRYVVRPHRLLADDEVPAWVATLLDRIEPWRALGFEHVAWVADGPAHLGPPYVAPITRVLRRTDAATWLHLRASGSPDPGCERVATLFTDTIDGQRVDTGDEIGSILWPAPPPSHRASRLLTASPEALVAAHDAAVAPLGALAADDLDAHLARTVAAERALVEAALARGDLERPDDPHGARPRFLPALVCAVRALSVATAIPRAKLARRSAADVEPLPPEAELEAWMRLDAMRAIPAPRPLVAAVLLVSGVLFALSMAWDADGLVDVAVITLTVLLHELGHWAAMRLRGYHDARIFFVPFLGGAAVGHKERVSLSDEMLVLLAGPLPGMLAGAALAIADAVLHLGEVVASLAFAMIAINALNLLPLFPLDGGRIAHRLLAQGRPVIEIGFRVLGALALIAIAIALASPLLGVFAAIILVTSRGAWHVAAIERAILDEGPGEAGGARRARILGRIRERMPMLTLANRLVRARELATRLDAPPAGLLARLVWLAIYGAAVLAVVPAVLVPLAIGALVPAVSSEARVLACPGASPSDGAPLAWPDGPATVWVEPIGAARAGSAHDRLRVYGALSPLACLPRAWSGADPDPVRTQRLARTLDALDEALIASRESEPLSLDFARWRTSVQGRMRAEIDARADLAQLDRELAVAWIAAWPASDPEGPERRAIAAHLGVPVECAPPVSPSVAWLDGSWSISSAHAAAEIPPVLAALCEGGGSLSITIVRDEVR